MQYQAVPCSEKTGRETVTGMGEHERRDAAPENGHSTRQRGTKIPTDQAFRVEILACRTRDSQCILVTLHVLYLALDIDSVARTRPSVRTVANADQGP